MAVVTSTVIAGGAALGSAYEQKRAGDRAARQASIANKAQARAEKLEGARRRVQAIRQNRIASADALNNAAQGGGGLNSTGTVGALAAGQSQLNANISFANQLDTLGSQVIQANAAGNAAIAQGNQNSAVLNGITRIALGAGG